MTTLAAWFHDLNPFVLRISGDFGIRWYGVAYLCGFLVAYLLLRWLSAAGRCAIPVHRIPDAMMWLIGGVLVGGRLGYMAVYDRALFVTFYPSFPFWGGLAINHGGMASHGGMVGVIVAAWRISRGWKEPVPAGAGTRAESVGESRVVGRCSIWHVFDLVALVSPAGLFFGRLANFINGELLGRIYSPPGVEGPWWTVQFPQELTERPPPLDAAQSAHLRALLEQVEPGSTSAGLAAVEHATHRLVAHAAQFKDQLKPLLSSRHPSQLYQAAAEGLVVGAVLWIIWLLRPARQGLIGAAFLITYGVLRVVTEFWRLPDAQFGEHGRIHGLSRGQWLSVAMVVAGVALAVYRLVRQPAPGDLAPTPSA